MKSAAAAKRPVGLGRPMTEAPAPSMADMTASLGLTHGHCWSPSVLNLLFGGAETGSPF
jgi:hypothetical protein